MKLSEGKWNGVEITTLSNEDLESVRRWVHVFSQDASLVRAERRRRDRIARWKRYLAHTAQVRRMAKCTC
jgi:hypothetical protein